MRSCKALSQTDKAVAPKPSELFASVFAAALLGAVPVLEPFCTGREPKELLPDEASCLRAKLQLWDSFAFQSRAGSHIRFRRVHNAAAMPAVWEVTRGMPVWVKGPGVAQTGCKKQRDEEEHPGQKRLWYGEVSPQQTTELPGPSALEFSAGSGVAELPGGLKRRDSSH